MKELRDRLTELFELCGISPRQVAVEPAPALLLWLEALLPDRSLYGYLDALNCQAEQAVRTMRERNLDYWNAQQNEKLLLQREQELGQLRRQLEEMKSAPPSSPAADAVQLELIRGVIAMRDNLLMRKRWLQDFSPGEEAATGLVEGQLQETARLLERAGVEIMDQGGPFDSRIHTVVETRAAPDPEQADQIAGTLRPGYSFRGEVIRSQEVILFIKAQEG